MNNYIYGVEIECICNSLPAREFIDRIQNTGSRVGSDGSIQCNPDEAQLELRTNPKTLTNTISELLQIESICRDYNVRVNESCGLHVHVSNEKFFNDKYLKRILGLWVAIEDVMFSTQPLSRLSSKYCQRRLASYAVVGFPKLPKAKGDLLDVVANSDRYYALNLRSLNDHGTIECRLHAGTLSSEKMINWIKLLTAIFNYCLDSYNGKKVNELFAMPISEKKIQLTWNLLKLDKDLQKYFNSRIEKFTLSQLIYQHQKAQELLKFRQQNSKEEKSIKKMFEQCEKKVFKAQQKADKLIKEAREKTKELTQIAKEKDWKLYQIKRKLLAEFVGENFKGDIDKIIHSWATHDSSRDIGYVPTIMASARSMNTALNIGDFITTGMEEI